jgi:acetyl-CoA carboxylase biotin carboxyl carrier protein
MSDREQLRALNEEALRLARDVGGPLRRLRLRLADAAVDLEWDDAGEAGGTATRPVAARTEDEEAATEPTDQVLVRSPMVGTFYHSPTPGEPPFVSVGVVVERDTVIGIVEAMKLMNRITADQSGVVRDVLVADGRAVEFEQPLLVLDPVPEHGWRNG